MEGGHVKGREELDVLLGTVPRLGVDGKWDEDGVIAEGGEELKVGVGHGKKRKAWG